MLVDMIDKVIEILETNPDYKAFHLDSQSIVVKDFLEIKPQNRERFSELVKSKRLFIGPWYILPEEFQVGGENLIRNLLLGHKICNSIGRVSKIGYSPFSWGQISQLPQIYSEFGINLIMFYRGINSIDSPKAEFIWEGADKTRMISSRFSTMPRYNFYFYIYRPVIHNEGFYDIEYNWLRGGTPFHFSDLIMADEDYFIINPTDEYFKGNIKPQVELIIKNQSDDFTSPHVIWMEGHDSSGPNEKTVRIIKDIKKTFPQIDVRHSTLEEYADLLISELKTENLKLVKGERRSTQFDNRSGNLYGYTTSARMYLKQKNFEAEKWIQFYAEPFNTISHLIGNDWNNNYIESAWELIIQNSAHDSIGGCSLDEIHEDMMFRYKQSIEISKGVFENSIKYIVKNINTSSINLNSSNPNEDIYLTIINPTNLERNEILTAIVDIPKNLDKGSLELLDDKNLRLPINICSRKDFQPVVEQLIDRPMYFDMFRYKIEIECNNIPVFGYKTFKVIPIKSNDKKFNKIGIRENGNFLLENDQIRIKVNSNGTFNYYEKIQKLESKNLGYFYDEGEAGHAWVNKPLKPFYTTLKSKPSIRFTSNSNLFAELEIKNKIKIPVNLKQRKSKKPKLVTIPITMKFGLSKLSEFVEIKILVDNRAESHRLRIMFPTFPDAEYSFGEGQFDVVKRNISRIDSKNWIEQPMYDFPMHNFVDVSNNKIGTAIFVDGLKEYEVLDDKNKTLAITLLRGFEYIIAPSSIQDYTFQKGSQCIGIHKYKLGYFLHRDNWESADVYNKALNFDNELRIVQHGSSNGELETQKSFFSIGNKKLLFSCLKKSEKEEENCAILRVYNPTESEQHTFIAFFKEIKDVEEVSLEENFKQELQLSSPNSFEVKFPQKKIKTFKVYF